MTNVSGKKWDQPLRIISGGQTGVDQTALSVAQKLGMACGGWCPVGRKSERGPIPAHFPLCETTSSRYPVRTRMNVQDSDATLIISMGEPHGGTALTIKLAKTLDKPCLVLNMEMLSIEDAAQACQSWFKTFCPRILNVAGPRASEMPLLQGKLEQLLTCLFKPLADRPGQPPPWPPNRPGTASLDDFLRTRQTEQSQQQKEQE